jgi:LmbE family N-acetylglucosaminyl deacetylase
VSVLHTLLGVHAARVAVPALGALGAVGSLRLLGRAQRVFHRLPVHLVGIDRARVLVIAPHMDDEVIGPGGTVLRHVAAGSQVGVVFASDGAGGTNGAERDDYVDIRKREALTAAEQMGTSVVEFLDHPDGQLCRVERTLSDELAEILRTWEPEQVFVPFPTDHHRDHQATASAAARAMKRTGWAGEVWTYEAWSPLWPNVSVDVTDVIDGKVDALNCHTSQVNGLDYVEATVGLNRFRGLRVGVPLAEAFYRAPAAEFSRVCARLTGRI